MPSHGECSVEGCGNVGRLARGYCLKHYERWRKHGDTSIVLSKMPKSLPLFVGCSVEGCEDPHEAKTFCRHHYKRWKRYGDPLGEAAPRIIPTCEACDRPAKARGLCEKHYQRLTRLGTVEITRPSLAERLWARVEKGEGCWEWQGARTKFGAGQIGVGSRLVYTHRIAWELTNGPVPEGLFVCHHCDNPPCVRPDHLFLGTARDNFEDMVAKGRGAWQRTGDAS